MFATTWRRSVALFGLAVLASASFSFNQIQAQESQFRKQLRTGEFSLALESASNQSDPFVRDRMYQQIAQWQRSGDTGLNAFSTLAMVQDDDLRFGSFDEMTNYGGFGSNGDGPGSAGQPPGNRGGITAQDFDELMNLIQETIDPDSWEDNGGVGRMSPFPAGVWVDSRGTLQRIKRDKSGRLDRIVNSADVKLEDGSLSKATELRKVSLSRLERELQMRAAAGKPISPDLKHLAGIYQLKYVILYPETGELVIAGPAGPWHFDRSGRAINDDTGLPVLNLDDLVVCLRNARRNNGQFGCSIDPRQQNLVAARQFVSTSTLKGKAFRDQLHKTLGQMDVTIEGIDPSTHAARVIVEADYRMKLIGLGVEQSVSGLKNYFDRIHLDDQGQLPEMDELVRWWFTMNYESVETNADRTVFELNGQGVKLLSESEFWNQMGQREHTGKSSLPAKGFADDFTLRFPEIASDDPVFGELKNVFDCAIVANLIHNEGLNRQVDWNLRFLDGDRRPGLLTWQLEGAGVPRQVDSILGQRVLTHREGRNSVRHTISGFGGGVEFDSTKHTTRNRIKVVDSKEMENNRSASSPANSNHSNWTWD